MLSEIGSDDWIGSRQDGELILPDAIVVKQSRQYIKWDIAHGALLFHLLRVAIRCNAIHYRWLYSHFNAGCRFKGFIIRLVSQIDTPRSVPVIGRPPELDLGERLFSGELERANSDFRSGQFAKNKIQNHLTRSPIFISPENNYSLRTPQMDSRLYIC